MPNATCLEKEISQKIYGKKSPVLNAFKIYRDAAISVEHLHTDL